MILLAKGWQEAIAKVTKAQVVPPYNEIPGIHPFLHLSSSVHVAMYIHSYIYACGTQYGPLGSFATSKVTLKRILEFH